jgi:hypothetical protein
MTSLIWIVSIALVAAKLGDMITTWAKVKHPEEEGNPLVKRMMIRIGVKPAILVNGLFIQILVVLMTIVALQADQGEQRFFVIVGSFLALDTAAIAHCNWTGRSNWFTRLSLSFYKWIGNLFKKKQQD